MSRDNGFWNKLPEICTILAPMAEVTDLVFRRMVAQCGKPDVLYTEFVSAEGLMSRGREVLMRDLQFDASEHPIVAQIFDDDPDVCARATEYICSLGFDGVDINMGCPDKSVMKCGAGASLIDDPDRAIKIIKAMKSAAGGLPISVKTRLGVNKDTLDTWLPRLLESGASAITIHARTAKEMSLVPARWERIGDAVKMAEGSGVRIIGNGDVTTLSDGYARAQEYGAGGFMVGRAAIGDPFFFSGRDDVTLMERLEAMREHASLFEGLMSYKPFTHVRKHLSKYAAGTRDIKTLRAQLMCANNADEVSGIVDLFLKK